MPPLLEISDNGLYCVPGGFHIDPWRPVTRAVITHAHSDHACRGSNAYLTAREGLHVLRARMGSDATIDTIAYGEPITLGDVRVSLHPAGHVLGSSQVRLECKGQVAVVGGDYKLAPDPTCQPFEPLRCNLFVSESTFGLPIYRWVPPTETLRDVNIWWSENASAGRPSVLLAYSLGKAQRLLAGLDASIGPVFTHGAVEVMVQAYRATGVTLPPTQLATDVFGRRTFENAIIVAPPSAQGSPWMRRFGGASTGFASGWMRIRGARRRLAVDRGFVFSDHADWPGLLMAIEGTRAEEVWVTHGYAAILARWLGERGLNARALPTRFRGEQDDAADDTVAPPEVPQKGADQP